MLEWLQRKEEEVSGLGPIGTDTETVKQQLSDLASIKEEVQPKHADVEFLNQQGQDLTRDATADQAAAVREPLQV